MAEAISYLLLPRGGPCLIDAVDCWERLAARSDYPSPYGD